MVALTPWLLSMYFFYWLDASGTWTSETPHRGKLSVAILASGMGLSFLLQSWFMKRGYWRSAPSRCSAASGQRLADDGLAVAVEDQLRQVLI